MTKVTVTNKKQLTKSEEEVLECFIQLQLAMIDKDESKLNQIITDNYTLTHMSGKTQTKEEYIEEILNGTLNYYKSRINNPSINIQDEDKATLRTCVTLDAKVYGIKGTWTLNSVQSFEKINNEWYMSKWEN